MYWLRDQNTSLGVPYDANNNIVQYTVFEHQTVPWLAAGYADGVTPRLYCTDPNPDSNCNEFDDRLYPGTITEPVTSTQTFSYGLKAQRQYWVRRILRKMSSTPTYVPINTPNLIVVNPFAEPRIDGWPAPYMGQGCNGNGWPPQ